MAKKIEIETLSNLVTRMGGDRKVATWLGIGRSGVSEIKRRKPGRLRPEHWMRFVAAAQAEGHGDVTYDYLALVHAHEHDTLPEVVKKITRRQKVG